MIAGSLAVVADVEDLPDLGEGESGGLAAVDEVDPGEALGRVVAVAAGRALGRGQEPLVFIEPQSLRGRAGTGARVGDTSSVALSSVAGKDVHHACSLPPGVPRRCRARREEP